MLAYWTVSPVRMRPMAWGTRFFEFHVGFVHDGNSFERFGESGLGFFVVRFQKFLGHPGFADDEVGAQNFQHVQDAGDVVAQGNVHGLDLRPEGEAAIGDDDGVGVADACEQRENVRIENSSFKHNAVDESTGD